MEYDLDEWLKGHTAIHVRSHNDAYMLWDYINHYAETHRNVIPMSSPFWEDYGKHTCYAVTTGDAQMVFYGRVRDFQAPAYTIISLDEIRYEIPDLHDCGSDIETLFE